MKKNEILGKLKEKAAPIAEKVKQHPKAVILSAAGIAAVCVIAGIVVLVRNSGKEEIVYKETVVEYGELSAGITESSSVDMENVTQSFDLDISALVKEESGSSSSSNGQMNQMGGMGQAIMGQIAGMTGSGISYSSEAADVTVEQVMVSVGQEIKQGDLLLKLTEESVEEIRSQLEEDFTEAENDLQSIESEQKSSKLEATQTYDSSVLYGQYAQIEYDEAIEKAEDEVESKTETLEAVQEELALYEKELESATAEYNTAVVYCTNITETVDAMDKASDPAWYLSLEETRQTAQSTVDTLIKEIETLEENIEKATEEADTCNEELEKAKRELERTKLSAKQTYDLRMLASNTAQETYDIAMGYLEEEAGEQQKAYDSAKEKLEAFDSAISEYGIYAEYDGVITEVNVENGDTITTDTTIVTLYNENVTMTATLEESDAETVVVGDVAKISLVAFPDVVFEGTVSEIGDAQYDSSSGNVYYDVTVKVDGSEAEFYQGMTGEVTFITKETAEVTYVSNRAITRKGTKSYVKIKGEDGKITEKQVVTGFSDGVNVEIKEGLSQGDIVLIESKVSDE